MLFCSRVQLLIIIGCQTRCDWTEVRSDALTLFSLAPPSQERSVWLAELLRQGHTHMEQSITDGWIKVSWHLCVQTASVRLSDSPPWPPPLNTYLCPAASGPAPLCLSELTVQAACYYEHWTFPAVSEPLVVAVNRYRCEQTPGVAFKEAQTSKLSESVTTSGFSLFLKKVSDSRWKLL